MNQSQSKPPKVNKKEKKKKSNQKAKMESRMDQRGAIETEKSVGNPIWSAHF